MVKKASIGSEDAQERPKRARDGFKMADDGPKRAFKCPRVNAACETRWAVPNGQRHRGCVGRARPAGRSARACAHWRGHSNASNCQAAIAIAAANGSANQVPSGR
eukprot:6548180-Pyramimonas_sp.AAC.1